MPTAGEFEYFRKLGPAGIEHATYKPWSDLYCGSYLMELGAMIGLMPRGGRLLDLGCGTGWTSLLFARRGYEVTGSELVPDALEAAQKLKEESGLSNLDFVQSDFENLPFENEFDISVFFDCLHHALDEEKALAGVYRALKPGGICITSEPGLGHAMRSKKVMAEYGVTERDMHPAKIIRAAKKAGFRGAKVYPHSTHLFTSIYKQPDSGKLATILKIPGMRSLFSIFIALFSKHISGIVVLRK
jgi:ubiquinone/menaquinone biosynthesis C-methylase UbiE